MVDKQARPLDIFKLTPRTNCGECGADGCMAFSLQVIAGQKRLEDCPYLNVDAAPDVAPAMPEPQAEQPGRRESILIALKKEMPNVDLAAVATKLGGTMKGDRLMIRCLGKPFEIDPEGGLHSEAHIHNWIHMPVLQYVVHGEGRDLTGIWTTFRQLNGFRDWNRFFNHRCEKAFYELAERYAELFFDLLGVFGTDIDIEDTDADRSIVLYPLPKVPIVFCYWAPEEGFESKLSLLFDKATEANLGAEGTYLLVQGIVEMFRKILARHAHQAV
jgi:hypothetical protein